MVIFSSMERLTDAEVNKLRPILFPVLAAAVNGAHEVTEYLKDEGERWKIPDILQPDEKTVYIWDCKSP